MNLDYLIQKFEKSKTNLATINKFNLETLIKILFRIDISHEFPKNAYKWSLKLFNNHEFASQSYHMNTFFISVFTKYNLANAF